MSGLVAYDSSDEDEAAQVDGQTVAKTISNGPERKKEISEKDLSKVSEESSSPRQGQAHTFTAVTIQSPETKVEALPSTAHAARRPIQGPTLGPAPGPSLPDADEGDAAASPSPKGETENGAPQSPYSASRSLIHDLTLPSVPNTAIPPSPPGSPPRALTTKFDTFLSLKNSKSIHFNSRLAGSVPARNPALMDKLLGFVSIETSFDGSNAETDDVGGAAAGPEQQYATTLPMDIWNPTAYPAWAYRIPLRRAQERAAKGRERGRGEAMDFVPASESTTGTPTAATSGTSRGGTPSVARVTGKRKTRFDT